MTDRVRATSRLAQHLLGLSHAWVVLGRVRSGARLVQQHGGCGHRDPGHIQCVVVVTSTERNDIEGPRCGDLDAQREKPQLDVGFDESLHTSAGPLCEFRVHRDTAPVDARHGDIGLHLLERAENGGKDRFTSSLRVQSVVCRERSCLADDEWTSCGATWDV